MIDIRLNSPEDILSTQEHLNNILILVILRPVLDCLGEIAHRMSDVVGGMSRGSERGDDSLIMWDMFLKGKMLVEQLPLPPWPKEQPKRAS